MKLPLVAELNCACFGVAALQAGVRPGCRGGLLRTLPAPASAMPHCGASVTTVGGGNGGRSRRAPSAPPVMAESSERHWPATTMGRAPCIAPILQLQHAPTPDKPGGPVTPTTVKEPLVSLVIPVYNAMPYLVETLDAIPAQGLDQSDFEVVLVNDGSDNGSERVRSEERRVGKESRSPYTRDRYETQQSR